MWHMCVVLCAHVCLEGRGGSQVSGSVTLCSSPETLPHWARSWPDGEKAGDPCLPTTHNLHAVLGSQAYVASPGFLYGCWVWTQVLIYRQRPLLHIVWSPKPFSLPFQIACEAEVICHLVYPYQVHNSEAVHTFTRLCDQQSPETIIEHSCGTQMKLRRLTNSGQLATPPPPWPLCFLCIWSFLHCVHDTYVT